MTSSSDKKANKPEASTDNVDKRLAYARKLARDRPERGWESIAKEVRKKYGSAPRSETIHKAIIEARAKPITKHQRINMVEDLFRQNPKMSREQARQELVDRTGRGMSNARISEIKRRVLGRPKRKVRSITYFNAGGVSRSRRGYPHFSAEDLFGRKTWNKRMDLTALLKRLDQKIAIYSAQQGWRERRRRDFEKWNWYYTVYQYDPASDSYKVAERWEGGSQK